MGEMTNWSPAVRPPGEVHPSEMLARIGTPMFCLDVLDEAPLDVVFSGINQAQSASTGIAPETLLGRRPYEALPPRGAANVMENYRRCLRLGRAIQYDEGYDGPEGEKWFRTTLSPWRDAEGRIVALVGSAVEITAMHRRADEDAAAIGRLTRLSDEVRTFAAMAAHDVRSPLATVEGLCELIAAEVEAGELASARSLLRDCGEMARGARGQMDELLRHANALGVGEAPASLMDLGRMGRDISAVVDPLGRVRMRWPVEAVWTDAVALQLILRNLMANAARHCRGRVAVALEPLPEGFCAFTVADDGPGFEGDPFAGEDVIRRHETASGFGLAAARYLVESRGGTIGVVPGAPGGVVRFTVPCRVPDAPGPRGGPDGA